MKIKLKKEGEFQPKQEAKIGNIGSIGHIWALES